MSHGHTDTHTPSHSDSHAPAGQLGDGSLRGQDFEEGLGHSLPLSTLMTVLISLIILTFVTVAVSRVNFGHWNIIIAMAIATLKATIVANYFMHLKFENKVILMYVFYPLVVLFIFIGGSFIDVAERPHVVPLGVPNNVPVPVIAGPGVHADGHGANAGHDVAPNDADHATGSGGPAVTNAPAHPVEAPNH